jgi:Spy/CpxP family protein refolding chaperone
MTVAGAAVVDNTSNCSRRVTMNFGVIRHRMVVVAGVLALAAVNVMAQMPGGGRGMGMGAADRPTTIERLGLNDASLKLSDAQKAQIDKIVDGYVAEQKTLREKYPMTPGSPPSQDAMTAMRSSRDNLNTAVGKVLDDTQRASWQAAQAARRPPGGGPGGGGAPR